ncbi:MAG: tyrosine-protein phosphatase [Vagococcus sp.]
MKTLVNFRDIGNKETKDGKKVKTGCFLRSGEVVGVETNEIERLLTDFRLKKIVDFRGESEVNERPDDTISGVDYINIDILKDSKEQGASLEELVNSPFTAHVGMMRLYDELILTKAAQKGYHTFLDMLVSHHDEPVLFHCFAGKDRTGLGAALILGSLDVPKSAILDDYLLTNHMRKEANQVIVNQLREKGMPEEHLKEVLVMMNVDQRYLEHSFDLMEKEYGGFKGYIKDALDMPESFFSDMKKMYTA